MKVLVYYLMINHIFVRNVLLKYFLFNIQKNMRDKEENILKSGRRGAKRVMLLLKIAYIEKFLVQLEFQFCFPYLYYILA